MKVHAAIAKALVDQGVDVLFGVIGDANLFMANAFANEFGGRYVAAANESGAALMAIGYAAVSGKVGVATTTYGPAVTNTITALIEGVKGQKPVVLICGDTPVEVRESLQDIPQRDHVMPTGAGFEQAKSVETIVRDLSFALRRAVLERRPIVFNVPASFQWQDVDYRPPRVRMPDARTWAPASDDLDHAVGMLASAKRPIILAGRGAVASNARAALIRLASRTEAMLATTLIAKDYFAGEEHDLGVFGTLSTPPAVDAIIESDCIVAFGASLTKYTTAQGSFVAGKRIIQCNLEPGEIGKNFAPDVGIVGDPAHVADVMTNYLEEAEIPPSGFRSQELSDRLRAFSLLDEVADRSTDTTIDVRRALLRLEDAVPADRVVVVDGGRFMTEAYKAFRVIQPSSFVFTSYAGSIGLGLSYAIGASFAAPARPVLLVAGDGGFMLGGLVEFNTAARYGVDLTVVLCNDGGYGAEHIQFRERQIDPSISLFNWPEFAEVANSLGGRGYVVRTMADLERAVEGFAGRDRPVLIDLKLDPDRMPDRPR
jgi:acetolactate synthase-1/2/3 large subunit